ncbi:NADPH:quinone reductase [Marmoricola sp. URHA0025 HA25]
MEVPATMKAWQVHESGEPDDVLQVNDVPVPRPEPGQALIRVAACGLNFPDVLQCRGMYHDRAPLPFTPGMELVGEVVAGTDLTAGRRVIALPTLRYGALAEYCIAPERDVFAVPDDMRDEDAAGFAIVYQTAWLALHQRAAAQQGETVLVHGASGGVGMACVQVARAAGLRVVATVRSRAKQAVVEAFGADLVVDTTETDFVAAVKDFTNGRGADVVIDPIGGEVFGASRRCIAWEGRLVVLGFMSNDIPSVAANQVLLKNFSVVGLNMGAYRQRAPHTAQRAHTALLELYASGALRPVLHPLADDTDARTALADLAMGRVSGKVVVFPFRA